MQVTLLSWNVRRIADFRGDLNQQEKDNGLESS
jgi:hypothetical protein